MHVVYVQVLGTPTREEIKCMNPNYTEFKFPQVKAHPWHKVIRYCCLCLQILLLPWYIGWTNITVCSSSDIPQAHSTRSCGPCFKAIAIFSKSTLLCCEYRYFDRMCWFYCFSYEYSVKATKETKDETIGGLLATCVIVQPIVPCMWF